MDINPLARAALAGLGTPRKHSAENPTCAYCAPTEQTKTLIARRDLRRSNGQTGATSIIGTLLTVWAISEARHEAAQAQT